jgi:thiamine pyrophosphate-dependent acetolactate synthase large subunit-like protein
MDEMIAGGDLDRRAVVNTLLEGRRDLLVVTGLGSAAYDVMAAGDHDGNYYLWAAMGSAMMVGLGLAAAQPDRPVLVVTGDGEALMGLGAMATIALRRPANLTIAILDNGHFGETGMQQSHAGKGIELHDVAAACGFARTERITTHDRVEGLRDSLVARSGLTLATIKIRAENLARVLPPRDGVYIKNRFRLALGYQPI